MHRNVLLISDNQPHPVIEKIIITGKYKDKIHTYPKNIIFYIMHYNYKIKIFNIYIKI